MAYDYLTKQRHKIGAKATVTINLAYGVNYFRVVNSGAASVYCGLSNMPTKNSYEFKVSGEAARMYAEDKLYKQIYIYNDGAANADIILYSFRAKFDPSVMALGDFAENQNKTVEVEIAGFTNPLPVGSNLIGKVGVESLPDDISTKLLALPNKDYTSALANILTAIGNISGGNSGDINVQSLPGDITSKLLALPNKDYTSALNNIFIYLSAIKNMYSPITFSETISGTTYSNRCMVIKMFTNDGESNMKLTWNAGMNDFIIKPGETITDMVLDTSPMNITITGESGTETISGRIILA